MFTHDTEASLRTLVALVNTAADGSEQLESPAALDAFLDDQEFTGPRVGDRAELESVHALRERLTTLWDIASAGDEATTVWMVNHLLTEYRAHPQVVRHGDTGWHIHATPNDAPLAERVAVDAAMALVDVLRTEALDRLRRCAGEGCSAVFVDFSRNGRRRFCDARGCANRAHVAAYRARRRRT